LLHAGPLAGYVLSCRREKDARSAHDEVILDGKGAKQADELASLSPRVFLPHLQSARAPRRSRNSGNASKPLVYEN
jgi:hypothetical protein